MTRLWRLLACCVVWGMSATAEASLEDARHWLAVGDQARARQVLLLLAQDANAPVEVFLYLGTMAREGADLEDARAWFERGVLSHAQDPLLLCELAMTTAWMGDLTKARALYERALAIAPDALVVNLGYGRVLLWSERYRDALAAFERATRADAEAPAPHVGRGDALRALLRRAASREAYEAALARDPENVAAREGLAHLAEDTRWTFRLTLGTVRFQRQSPSWLGRASVAVRVTHRATLEFRYAHDVPSGVLSDGVQAIAHTGALALNYRFRGGAVWESAYSFQRQASDTHHRLSVGGALPLRENVLLLGHVRPGIQHNAAWEVTADLGLQWVPHASAWLMAQVFVFDAASESFRWTAVGTAFWQLHPLWAVRLGGSVGRRDGAMVPGVNGSLACQVSRRVRVEATYGGLHDQVWRHEATVQLVVQR